MSSHKYYSNKQAYKNKAVIKGLLTFLGILLICGALSGDLGLIMILVIMIAIAYALGSMCPDQECTLNLVKATPVVAVILCLITGLGIGAVLLTSIGGIMALFAGRSLSEQIFYDRRLNKRKIT